MKLSIAQDYALTQLSKHGLTGWTFKWKAGAKNIYGQCNHRTRIIYLQPKYTAMRPQQDVFNTILHEIAHALVGYGAGHGPAWQSKCAEIGYANATRCSKALLSSEEIEDHILTDLYQKKEFAKRHFDRRGVSQARRAIRKYLRRLS